MDFTIGDRKKIWLDSALKRNARKKEEAEIHNLSMSVLKFGAFAIILLGLLVKNI